MIGLDTNILVRFFARDDPALTAKADKLMEFGTDFETRPILFCLTATQNGLVGVANAPGQPD